MYKITIFVFLIMGIYFDAYPDSLKSPVEFQKKMQENNERAKQISFVSYPFVLIIKGYQKVLGPIKGSYCPMYPSCSYYGLQAVQNHSMEGILMAIDRLHRCGHDLHFYKKIIVDNQIKNLDVVKGSKDKEK